MKRTTLLVAAALGAAMPLTAIAQYRVDNSARNDANNRLGSGGYNAPVNNAPRVTGNQIINRNVSGGWEFRDRIPYADQGAFRGTTAWQDADRFVRNSAGTSAAYSGAAPLTVPQPFYGQSRLAPPPAGYLPDPGTQGYVAPRAFGGTTVRQGAIDTRLGNFTDAPVIEPPKPGELMLPGPVDASNLPTLITASPLYGIRQWQSNEAADRAALDELSLIQQQEGLGAGPLPDEQILRLREQLNQAAGVVEGGVSSPVRPGPDDQPGVTPAAPDAGTGAPNDGTVGPQSLNNPLGHEVQATPAIRTRLLVPPTQQSAQYAALRRQLAQMYGDKELNDEEAFRKFQTEQRLRERAAEAQKAKPGPGQAPAAQQRPDQVKPGPRVGETPVAPPPMTPVPVKSLATGVKAKGLADLLTRAEVLMKEGKFASAIEVYKSAGQVAPNNSLGLLGQAHAELGGAFYAQADAHLRQALRSDPTLLMGIYDLKGMIGSDRLAEVIKDLKKLAVDEPKSSRPVFLLTYIAYNTDNPDMAAKWLDEAERREGAEQDRIYGLLRKHWQLAKPAAEEPSTRPTTQESELNK